MLDIDDLSVRVAGRLLIDQATARITPGSRVGLVGRNGSGKSTLFNVITGDHPSEQGAIELPPRWRVGRLAQEAPNGPESLIDVVLAADVERASLLAEADTATDPHRIAEIQLRLADIGAYAAPSVAASILSGLGFSEADQARPCSEFSGGWRMRVALAAVLFSKPDLLLLDEPTNYLDLEGTLWLQDHLARYPHTMIVISHDRDLLDTSVNFILSLENAKLTLYRGGYSAFEKLRNERLLLDQKAVKKQEAQRKHLQAFVDRFKAKASKARQAQSRVKMLEKLAPIAALSLSDVQPINIPAPDKLLSPPIVTLDDVSVGYEPGRPILRKLSLRIDDDDRIALLGSNGNGKSTLVKLIAARLAAQEGTVTRAPKLKIAYFAQHQLDELNPDESVYQHLRDLMPDASETKVRARRRLDRIFWPGRRYRCREAIRRRKSAADARPRDVRGPAPPHPRRAHQPSRHRQPRRADRGDQRLSRRHHTGLARPPPARRLRRPLVAGRQWARDAVRRRSRRLPAARADGSRRHRCPSQAGARAKAATRRSAAQQRRTALASRVAAAEGDQGGGRHRPPHPRDRETLCRAGYPARFTPAILQRLPRWPRPVPITRASSRRPKRYGWRRAKRFRQPVSFTLRP